MLGAGVRRFGGPVEVPELPGPRELRPDEVLIDVQACGVGNWDEFARAGEWDLGITVQNPASAGKCRAR